MKRRQFIVATGAMGLSALAYPTIFEPEWLELTRRKLVIPGLTPSRPIRLIHIADLHASVWVPMLLLERAIEMCISARPDFVCATGDFVTFRSDFDRARYVRALRRLANAAPVFAVLGNHDGGEWSRSRRGYHDTGPVRSILQESGIRLLHNQNELLSFGGAQFRLIGVGDLWASEIDAPRAFANVSHDEPAILMSHNPDTKAQLASFPWNLMLSGHTHGGQVILPWWGTKFAPVMDKRYVAGLKPWGTRQIHVTRGVGSLGSVRFRCRPEVSLIEL